MDIFEAAIESHWPLAAWRKLTVVAAVSGGADSMALLRALVSLASRNGATILAGHLNHSMRGALSDEDEAFVRQVCQKFGAACHVERVDPSLWREAAGDGFEAAARQARHAFLERLARQRGARHIVTAHTADDQVETVLHRILRGAGLRGLAGMAPSRPLGPGLSMVRPMLHLTRAEARAYLQRLGQPWRQDASNFDLRHTRNRLRHELLPELRGKYNPAVDDALLRLARLAGEAQETIVHLAGNLADRCVTAQSGQSVTIRCDCLAGQPRPLVREALLCLWRQRRWPEQAMDASKWDALCECAQSTSAADCRFTLPAEIDAHRQGGLLTLQRRPPIPP